MPAKFDVSTEDSDLIAKIVERTLRHPAVQDMPSTRRPRAIDLNMSLCACHASGCPLRLADLLEAADFDLLHDVLGTNRHISRETGQLQDCFCPRYAAPQRSTTTAMDDVRRFAEGLSEVAEEPAKPKGDTKSQMARKRGRTQRLRAPGLDDGESPFFPIPGISSAGEY